MPHLTAKKSLGQNFLKNPKVVATMIEAARLSAGDRVLEIGPGTGMLTEGLLATGATVVALEADHRAIDILTERFSREIAAGTLLLHHADVRTANIPEMVGREPYTVVANIPYYLTGLLLRSTLSGAHQPKTAVFLVQKEVAARIARSKKESLLSLSVKVYGTPKYVATVSRGNFSPAPAVDSAILAITDISRARFGALDEAWFFTVIHAGFAARRKQLAGTLRAIAPQERIAHAFAALGLAETIRGEDLTIDTWCALAEALTEGTR